MGMRIHPNSTRVTKVATFGRAITVRAFYKRLTFNERKVLRNSAIDEVVDLREELMHSKRVRLTPGFAQQLLDTGLLSQARVDELLVPATTQEEVED